MRLSLCSALILSLFFSLTTHAQQSGAISDTSRLEKKVMMPYKTKRLYTGKAFDMAILSSSMLTTPFEDAKLSVPRFTMFLNGGVNVHYDMSRYFGIFSGLTIKNIGVIEKLDDITIKRRVYSAGIPLGLKIGDLRNRNFFFLGGGLDIPFNYKEKAFKDRGDKEKFNEWFSKRTPSVMPFFFIGNSWDPGLVLKLQYYPGNFLNTDFVDKDGNKPYAGYNVNLILLSFGVDIHYNKRKVAEREYQEWKKARANERKEQ